MKALLIHQAFVSGNEPGGTRHAEFAQHVRAQDDELIVIASQVGYLTGQPIRRWKKRRVVQREEIDGVQVQRAFAPSTLHRGFAWRVFSFIIFSMTSVWAGLRTGQIDVVVGTSPPIFQGVSALAIARLKRRPFLLEIRDLWPEFAIDMGVLRNPLLIRLSRWLEAFLYRRANHIVVNSPAYVAYLHSKGIPSSRVTLISNGVDVDTFDPALDATAFRQKNGIAASTFVAIYAGAHGPANDLDQILDAAERLRSDADILFLFVGDGKDKQRLQRTASERKLANVRFLDPVPKQRMPDVLAAADVCLATLKSIPMFRMTYPNKVFDYMAAGRPTLLTIDGVIREVIEKAEGGLYVPAGDIEAFAEALRSLASHPDTARTMGRSAREYVESNFNRESQSESFRLTLRQLIN